MSMRLPARPPPDGAMVASSPLCSSSPPCVMRDSLGHGTGIDVAAARHATMWRLHGVRGMGGSAPQRSSPQRKITFCYGDVLHRSGYGDREECADATRA